MRLIIAGGRDFDHRKLLLREVEQLTKGVSCADIVILSGGAKGADRLGEELADFYQIKLERYPADWDKYGKSAGYRRNVEMAQNATHLIAFWDGKSKGTKHMIDIARKEGLQVKVVGYE